MAELNKNMSREIKFRAFIKNELGGFMVPNEETDCFMVSNGNGFVVYDEYKNTIPEDRISIMQFTGLKDKNGVDIYEGDIVRLKGGRKPKNGERPYYNTVVVFERGMFKIKENRTIFTDSSVLGLGLCEVIGSIHEKPELLND